DDDIRIKSGRLAFRDQAADRRVDVFIERMLFTHDAEAVPAEPIVARRRANSPVILRILPVPPAARSPFLGARALLTFTPIEPRTGPCGPLLSELFGLTSAEAKLASLIAEGIALETAAEELGIARETARNQLKAVFAKTGTHRQGELIALL